MTDESAFYYSSSNPSTEASFNGDILFSTGLNLNTPLGVSEYVEVHFRRNVTSALELDKDLKITASVDYTNPAGECVLLPSVDLELQIGSGHCMIVFVLSDFLCVI